MDDRPGIKYVVEDSHGNRAETFRELPESAMNQPTPEQLRDELEYERSERESFVEELEALEQQVISLADSIREKPTRQISTRPNPQPTDAKAESQGWVDGLPPVGQKVEYQTYAQGKEVWLTAVVVGYHNGAVVMVDDESNSPVMSKKPRYRPLLRDEVMTVVHQAWIEAVTGDEAADITNALLAKFDLLRKGGE